MKDEKRAAPGKPRAVERIVAEPHPGVAARCLNAASRDDRTGEISVGGGTDQVSGKAPPRRPRSRPPLPPRRPRTRDPRRRPAAAWPARVRDAKVADARAKHFEAGDPTTQRCARPRPGRRRLPRRRRRCLQDAGRAGQAQGHAQRLPFRTPWSAGWWWSAGPGSAPSGPSTRATTPSAGARTSASRSILATTTISSEEQAYIRYDSMDRSFLFVPNLSKTNIVAINDKKPTGAVKLELMDVITMGRTQLAFVPFCGEEFDWSELSDLKE